MISVAIIGKGNVSHHLFKAFSKAKGIDVSQINSRKLKNIPKVDIVIIAVSDDAISEVSSNINDKLIVHTSGSVSLNSLKNKGNKGVFYPLQSFSKDKNVDFNTIPFCLEAENEKDLKLLKKLAKSIGKKVYKVNSEQRKSLHVSAVFVNNFVNHLYKIGSDICNKQNVPFEILHPLIEETASKIAKLSPEEAQTGPAKRNDLQTIQKHIEMLTKEQQEIYQLITKSIQNNGEKL